MSSVRLIVLVIIFCITIDKSLQKPEHYGITQSQLPGTRLKSDDTLKTKSEASEGSGEGGNRQLGSGEGIVKQSTHYVDTTSYESSLENDDDSGSGSGEEFYDEELVRSNTDDNDGHKVSSEESGFGSGKHSSDESGDFNTETQNGDEIKESAHDYMINLQPSTGGFDPFIYPSITTADTSSEGSQASNDITQGFSVGDNLEQETSEEILPMKIQNYKNSLLKGSSVGSKMVNDSTERKSNDDNKEKIPTLPILDILMETQTMLREKYSFKGCLITVLSSGCKITLDLTNPLCKDVVSLPRLYKHMIRRDLDKYENFIQVNKFNVDEVNIDTCEKSITFVSTAKERFELIRGSGIMVRSGTLDLEHKYERNAEPTFISMAFDIAGQIKIANISTYFSLRKSKLTTGGTYSFNLPNITASEFYQTFTKEKELDPNTIANMSQLVDIKLPTAKVTGNKNENGDSELILTSEYGNLNGFGQCKIQVVVHKQIGRHASAGVIVGIKKVDATSVVKLLTGVELPNVPLVTDQKLNVIIEHANYIITPSRNDDIHSKFLKSQTPTKLEQGTKVKAVILLANQKGEHHVYTFIDMIIKKGNISIQIPENTAMQLVQVLSFVIPDFDKMLFSTVVNKTVKVQFLLFDINVQTKDVLVIMDSYHGFKIGRNFTFVQAAKFILIRQYGKWQFSIAGSKLIKNRVLNLLVNYEEDKYVLKGNIDKLSALDIIDQFNARGRVSDMIDRNKKLDFSIENVRLNGTFGSGMKIRVLGDASYLGYKAEFEGYIIDVEKPTNLVAFGISTNNINTHDFAKKILDNVKEKGVSMLDVPWLSNASASIVLADKSGIDKVVFTLPNLKENEYLGEYNPTEDQGASFVLKVVIPEDCKKVTMCKLLRKQLGTGSVLRLSGEINPSGFEVMTLIKGKIEIANNYIMEKSNLALVIDEDAEEFSLNGEMMKQMDDNEVKFKASIKQQNGPDVIFELSMDRDWESPFNITYVTFADFLLKAEINNGVMQDRFAVSGDIQIGFGSNPFRSALCGVVEVSNDKAFFYTKIESFSLEAVHLAFKVRHGSLEVLKDIQAPAGIVAGFAYPKPRRIQAIGMVLDREFAMKDKLIVLGYKIFCVLRVVDHTNVQITGKFDHLLIANELISVLSKDRSEGPMLHIRLTPNSAEFKIQGYVKVLRIGGEAELYINNDGINFDMTGPMLGLFNTTVSFSAPYKDLSQIKEKEFKVNTCLETEIVHEIRKKAIKEIEDSVKISKEADKESTNRYESAESWFKKGLEKVEEWRMKMSQREIKLAKKREELNEFKKKLQTDCVEECSKSKIPVGGIGIKECHVGKEKIKCPYWIAKKHMQDDPLCLAKCEVKSIFRRKELTSLLSKSDFKEIQRETQRFSKLGKISESFFRASRTLIERAKETSLTVAEVGKAGDKASKMIEIHSLQNILKIEDICLKATLDKADQGCFKLEFTAFIGNKPNPKKVLSEEVETCLIKNYADVVAKIIAYQAFPRLAPVKMKYEKIKTLLDSFDNDAKTVLDISKKLEAEESSAQSRTLKDDTSDCNSVECASPDYESDIPEIVVRNDRTMEAFRDIFLTNDNIEDEFTSPDKALSVFGEEVNLDVKGMFNEKKPEDSPSKSVECRQIQNIMGVYKDISDSIVFMQHNNKQLKDRYEAYIKNHQKNFDQLEESTLAEGRLLNLTDDEQNDAMFYIQKGKDGIAHWKEDLDKKYENIDRLSLQFWREFIKDDLLTRKPIVKGLFDFEKIPSIVSKRYGIPHPFSASMKHAHRLANHLFDDAGSISTNAGRIFDLANHVHYMVQAEKMMKC